MSRLRSVLSSVTQYSLCHGTRIGGTKISLRLNHGRSLALTSHRLETSKKPAKAATAADAEEEEVNSQPIKFSTSKASHRHWKVAEARGSKQARPLWRVLPFSVLGFGFFLWCFFRGESQMDRELEVQLYERLPSLFSNDNEEEDEEEEDAGKSS